VDGLPYEIVSVTASDGVRLVGRYYHFYDGAPLQILFHGYRGCGVREFAGNNRLAKALKFNALVVDERGHGKSGGHTITFGIKERYDCLTWARYAAARFGERTQVFLSGVSMGAATVLMASGLQLPENVKAITADCPFSSPAGIIRKVSRDIKLPVFLAYPLTALGAMLFGGFRLGQCTALEAVQAAELPILLIHGEDDLLVPCEMSREIYRACKAPAELAVFPGAGHGISYFTDPERYQSVFSEFLHRFGLLA
jgi:fermentation-respiration switch protein FrsA (DUF1100 family)